MTTTDLTPTPISSRLLLESQKATREDLEKYLQPQSNKGDDPLSRQASWHSVQLPDSVQHDGGADEGLLRLHRRLWQEQGISGDLAGVFFATGTQGLHAMTETIATRCLDRCR